MLQMGSKGQEVKELQEKLISRGYSVGSYGADGDFGQGTYDAVIRFQRDHGLEADGIVGPDTMRAINGSIATKLLKKGDTGSAVKELQQKLISKGFSVGPYGADGDFGQGTYDAVIKFQSSNGLSADGIVGPATWSALLGFSNGALLRLGDNGPEVKSLQEKLISRGYSVGAAGADGDFGQGTYNAVVKFQRDNGLLADGIVGPATWGILNGATDTILLRLGSKGENVRRLQEKLISNGYNVGPAGADGDFGQGTYNAVVSFQTNNGLEADGIVGPNTWYALNTLTGGILLRMGDNGPQVKRLQELLISKGYSVGSYGADGDFGQGTYNAVIKFQRDHGLDADGVVGPATWKALGGTLSNGLLRLGSKGPEVKRLQELLISKGYSVGSYGADGDFGQGTHNAVIKFQSDNGLSADGIVGPATWGALNGYDNSESDVIIGGSGVSKFLKVAISQIGYKETPVNITKYGAWYGVQDEWCAMFISWCANQAGILSSVVPRFAWCASGAEWYRSRGRFRARLSTYTPQPGDVLFFYDSGSKYPYYHVGIVEYTSNNIVHTIEGNSSDMVKRCSYPITYSKIGGYGVNGGTLDLVDSNILKRAGNEGIFKDSQTRFSGFNMETPISIISMVPLISVRGKVTLRKSIQFGKTIEITSDSQNDLAVSIASGVLSQGISFDFTQENIRKTLQGINAGVKSGDSLTYQIQLMPGRIVEATIEYKLPIPDREVYQAIIIRIEQRIFEPIKVPIVAEKYQESLVSHNHRRPIKVPEAVQTTLALLTIGTALVTLGPTTATALFAIFVLPSIN